MPRPVRPWFRVYVEMIGDRKIRRLAPVQRWIWVAILAAARESPEPGRLLIAAGVAMTTAELASFADVKERDVRATLAAAETLGMVERDGDVVVVRNWDVRQFETDNVTARTRVHRKERSNDVPTGNVGTAQRRSREQDSVARRNGPETETETETEPPTTSVVGRASAPRATERGTRLPDGWRPTPADVAWARSEAIPDDLCRAETAKFCDYWPAQPGAKGRKSDWSATWRNWIRKAVETAATRRTPMTPTEKATTWLTVGRPMPDAPRELGA